MKKSFVVVTSLVLLISAGAPSFAVDDLLSAVIEGCRNAVSSIKSGKGTATRSVCLRKAGGGFLETDTSYTLVFSGDKFRLSSRTKYLRNDPVPEQDAELLYKPGYVYPQEIAYNGESTTLFLPHKKQATIGGPYTASARRVLGEYKHAAIRRHGLAEIDKHVLLPDTFNTDGLQVVGRESIDGDECVLVELRWSYPLSTGGEAKNRLRFWVDPAKGFVVPRIRSWAEGGIYDQETLTAESATQFRQYGDGVWVPATSTHDEFRIDSETGASYRSFHAVISFHPDCKCNLPVSESELALTLPSGTKVYNEMLDERYTVP